MTREPLLVALFETAPFPIYIRDASHRLVYANATFRALAGGQPVDGSSDTDLLAPSCIAELRHSSRDVLAGSERLDQETLKSGTRFLTLRRSLTLPDGETLLSGIVVRILNSSDAASRLQQAGLYDREQAALTAGPARAGTGETGGRRGPSLNDSATGLRNRDGFRHDLDTALCAPPAGGVLLCVAFIDLDRFKFINDTYGHKTGDQVLSIVSRRMMSWPGILSAGRMGGDEFAILFEHVRVAPHILVESISRRRTRIFRSAEIGGKKLQISGSVGLSVYGLDASVPEALLLHADTALLEAKRLGRERVKLFDAELALRTSRRNMLERDIPSAITEGHIFPVYQPIFCARTRQVSGVEVLARWNHPVLGPVPAQEFVAVAADCGLVTRLDQSIVKRASPCLRKWISNQKISFAAFNVHGADIVRPGYAGEFLSLCRRAGLPAGNICLEIVESDIVGDVDRARDNILSLKEKGVHFALDDYGTGYSNLRSLIDLPIDRIKIDRSIVADIGRDERAMKLAVSVASLARVMGADLVAEGVEDTAQAAYLEAMSCNYLQGYLFGAPAGDEVTETLLSQCRSAAA